MLALVGKGVGTLQKYPSRNIGRLVHPRDCGRVADTPRLGFLWAADNDAYSGFHEGRYLNMLNLCAGVPGCLFVTCPDVVGDADQTFDLYLKWSREILGRDLPLGYVLQDGITPESTIPWNGLSAVFLGGSDEFKLSEEAAVVVAMAKDRGKWVHMGRVNSQTRVRYAKSIGCDSFDGSSLSRWTDTFLAKYAEIALAPTQEILH